DSLKLVSTAAGNVLRSRLAAQLGDDLLDRFGRWSGLEPDRPLVGHRLRDAVLQPCDVVRSDGFPADDLVELVAEPERPQLMPTEASGSQQGESVRRYLAEQAGHQRQHPSKGSTIQSRMSCTSKAD